MGLEAELDGGIFVNSYAAIPLRDGPLTTRRDATLYLSVGKSW